MTNTVLPFEVRQAIVKLGENLRTARIRRQMSKEDLATAAQISRKTLYALEKGAPGVSMGTLVSVLWALGLLDTATAVADPDTDEHGRILEAARRPKRVGSPSSTDNDF
ncbi:MAG: helix-turn-helix domain-containing protein [Nannocystis sp.]|nr:helix-turn-helix domain-containing protein [Nannocystis sp.]MBA3546620.1 helix-turn-helix domain-containing protein [Nannocystis sp.]